VCARASWRAGVLTRALQAQAQVQAQAGAQAVAWIANLVELLRSDLTATLKEAAVALEKALKTSEGRGALLAHHPDGVARLMACLHVEDPHGAAHMGQSRLDDASMRTADDDDRANLVRSASRAVAALSMDSAGRRAVIGIVGSSSSSPFLLDLSALLRSSDVDTSQCASLIVGNLVCSPRVAPPLLSLLPPLLGPF